MKKTIVLSAFLILASCAEVSSLTTQPIDKVEISSSELSTITSSSVNFNSNNSSSSSFASSNMVPVIKHPEYQKYNFPRALKLPEYTPEEIKDMVGLEPEILREKLNTAFDVLAYMKASNYSILDYANAIRDGDYHYQIGSLTWSTNIDGPLSIKINFGNCGGTSNMVRYLLNGDYDEVGFLTFNEFGGGHVFNYIKQDGVYYNIDFIQFRARDYQRFDYVIAQAETLEKIASDYVGQSKIYGMDIMFMSAQNPKNDSHFWIGIDHEHPRKDNRPMINLIINDDLNKVIYVNDEVKDLLKYVENPNLTIDFIKAYNINPNNFITNKKTTS